jgi:hypothetical protein
VASDAAERVEVVVGQVKEVVVVGQVKVMVVVGRVVSIIPQT